MVDTTYHVPGAPGFALLSDLHNHPFGHVLSSLSSHAPSLILIAGDVINGSIPEEVSLLVEEQKNVLPFLSTCSSLAPTFLSLGNHEQLLCDEDLQLIAATGVTVLDNRWERFTADGKVIVIGGLTSGYVTDYRAFRAAVGGRYPKKENLTGIRGAVTAVEHKPDVSWLPNFATQPGYKVCLCHHPEYFPLIPDSVELVCSGHAHGGQIRVFNHGLWCPGQGFWPKYTRGVYEENRLVVSTGLSNTTWVPRIFNPPEVIYVSGN